MRVQTINTNVLLYDLARTLQGLNGNFRMYLDYVSNDSRFDNVPSVDIVTAWGNAKRDNQVNKEIELIYGREFGF